MSEADILATTYDDTCTIYRPGPVELPSGETVFKKGREGQMIANDVPCALSGHSGGSLRQSPSTAKAPTTFSLFTRPEVDVQAGDTLVIRRLGREIVSLAGLPDYQPSHNNIPLIMKKDTV